MADPPLLAARGVAKRFGPVVALTGVDLVVEPGEIHALLGANGAGKSTLVKILSGVIGPDQGSLSVRGQDVQLRRPADAARVGLATVFQDPAFVPDLTVAENLRLTGARERDVLGRMADMGIERVDPGWLVGELPLPLLRMLDLARALVRDPHLLLLDEITAALPADLAETVFAVMRERRDRGASVLFISHRLGEVLAACDRATVLRNGRDVARFVPGEVGEAGLVGAMRGEAAESEPAAEQPAPPLADAPVALEARGLSSRAGLSDVSFALRTGEVLGVAALEGQGQDVLFDVLAGMRRADGGEVLAAGTPLTARSPADAIRRGVVLVPGDRLHALLPQRSVAENLSSTLYSRPGRWGGLRLGDERRRVRGAVERLQIDTRAQRQVRRLSGGNQQKVTIGRWLTAGFSTLLCFDPTRGIDIGTKEQIYRLLRELAAEGTAVLLYTSELGEIPKVCDRVLVLYGGRVVHEQDGASADETTLLSAAHGLGSREVTA